MPGVLQQSGHLLIQCTELCVASALYVCVLQGCSQDFCQHFWGAVCPSHPQMQILLPMLSGCCCPLHDADGV